MSTAALPAALAARRAGAAGRAPAPARLLTAALLLALWLGAALLTAAVVAPAAFAVLPTRALAGALVGRVLPAVFLAGVAAGLAAAFLGRATGPFDRARLTLALATAALCVAAQFGVGPRIQAVRAQIGPDVEALAKTDPRRQAFGRLHGVSVLLMGAAGLAAGGALLLTALAATRDRATA